jgi:hypothetical protein
MNPYECEVWIQGQMWPARTKSCRRQNQRLQEDLEKAHIIIDVQKKVAKLLGRPIPEISDTEK